MTSFKNKSYKNLTKEELKELQEEQNRLVAMYQDAQDPSIKEFIVSDIYDLVSGLISHQAKIDSNRSYTETYDDFMSLYNLSLAKALESYDRDNDKGVPFQPFLIYTMTNDKKMLYRSLKKDAFHATDSMDEPVSSDSDMTTKGDLMSQSKDQIGDMVTDIEVDRIINSIFPDNQRKASIVRMKVNGFKRREIVQALFDESHKTDSANKEVERAWNQFKKAYLAKVMR